MKSDVSKVNSSSDNTEKLKTAVLVSGGGTNLQALIDYEKATPDCPYTIVCVISDHKDAYALQRAAEANIPSAITSPYSVMGKEAAQAATRDQKRLAVSDAMLKICQEYKAQAIVEAGCLTVLAGDIIKQYDNKIINLHPALLPKFGGVGMWGHHVHEAVIAANEKESGCESDRGRNQIGTEADEGRGKEQGDDASHHLDHPLGACDRL